MSQPVGLRLLRLSLLRLSLLRLGSLRRIVAARLWRLEGLLWWRTPWRQRPSSLLPAMIWTPRPASDSARALTAAE
jgi:hypothetical protein